MMISLTTPLAPQQLHALGRQDEQGRAEPMRETAAATCVQCCAHRHPAADCDKLGGSGACPAWCVKGERDTNRLCPFALSSSSSPNLHVCCQQGSLPRPSILGRRGEEREDGQGSLGPSPRVSQTVTILTLAGTQTQQPFCSQQCSAWKTQVQRWTAPIQLGWERLRFTWLCSTGDSSCL